MNAPRLPAPEACDAILREAGCPRNVVAHAGVVARVATQVVLALRARGRFVDDLLVVAGAWLHDIGRARSHGLDHALVGANMLRDQGYPEPLCLIVERHTGGGIDPDEARLLGLPPKDYTPQTLEEKIVCQADNLVDGTRRQKVQEELDHLRGRGLDRVAAKIERLHAELSRLVGLDLDDLP